MPLKFKKSLISEETYDFYEQNSNKTLLSMAFVEKNNWSEMIPGNVNINMNLYKLYIYLYIIFRFYMFV